MTKFLIAVVLGICAFQGWKYFQSSAAMTPIVAELSSAETSAVATIGAMPVSNSAKAEVTLYATSWCGYCRAARKFFETNGVAFKEYDIEKSEEGAKQYRALGGTGSVPLITVGETTVRGFSETKLRTLIGLKS